MRGFFHPTTGYSLAYTMHCAEALANSLENEKASGLAEAARRALLRCRRDLSKSTSFLCGLNRMLFLAAVPQQRWRY